MKTIIRTTTAIFLTILVFNTSLKATGNKDTKVLNDNDIELNTKMVNTTNLYKSAISTDFNISEEQYIDDIPFNTKCISTKCLYRQAVEKEFNFEEEGNIDDIPFSTRHIYMQSLDKINR